MENFFGIVILNGSSELVDWGIGEEAIQIELDNKGYYYHYTFNDINAYQTFLSVYVS